MAKTSQFINLSDQLQDVRSGDKAVPHVIS